MGKKVLFAFMAIATMIAIATSCNNEKKVLAFHDTAVSDSTLKKDVPLQEFYKENLEGKKAFIERFFVFHRPHPLNVHTWYVHSISHLSPKQGS